MVLVCVGTLVKLEEVDPICAVAGIFPGFCLRGVLNVDEHGFLDGPGLHVNFLMYYAELVGVHWMSCGGAVEVYVGGGIEMFLNSFPQGSARLTNVGTRAFYVWALVFVDDSCLDLGKFSL